LFKNRVSRVYSFHKRTTTGLLLILRPNSRSQDKSFVGFEELLTFKNRSSPGYLRFHWNSYH